MAQEFQTASGTLTVPGAYSEYTVQSSPSGLSTNGVLILVGEADAGPDYTLETTTSLGTGYGPDQATDVKAKYLSGPLVDAFLAATVPSSDPTLTGSPSRVILVKTNVSTKASSALTKIGGGTYGTLYDKNYGKLGNLIYYTLTANASEVIPTTGSITWIPNVGTVDYNFRVNGGAAVTSGTLAANRTPAQAQTAFDGLAGVSSTGGAARTTIQAGVGTLALSIVSGNAILLTYSGTFTTTPSVGDTVVIPTGSVVDGGAGDDNVGAYVVTAATSSTINCTKLSDAGKAGAVPGVITAPLAVGAAAVSGTPANDMVVYAPIVITLEAAAVTDGVGKSLEINELTSGTDLLSRCLYALSTTAYSKVSKSSSVQVVTSGTEYSVKLNVNRQYDNIQEEYIVGGEIALKIGYKGTTATMTITDTALTTTVAGGTGANLSITLKDFPTINDLVAYINAQTGYTAAAGTNVLGTLSTAYLDNVTAMGICTTHGAQTGRVKIDAYRFYSGLSTESTLVQLGNPAAQAGAGIPDVVTGTKFLSGGTKGGTTDAIVSAALTKLESIRGNFLIPLFSQDASEDITDGLTESSSTYTIDSINAAFKTHVIKMSHFKKRKHRQAFVSKQTTFETAKESSANLNSHRVAMCFQDMKNLNSAGTLTQFQPWMSAAVAAGMQAAGRYKGILHKLVNCSGVLQAAADYDDQLDTHETAALKAGLLPLRNVHPDDGGGVIYISDQTTYGKDSNFVFNSIQAVYIADLISNTSAIRMEKQFTGQSVADVSAALALTAFEGIMQDFINLKFIAPSDDAPLGYKNLKVKLVGRALKVECEVKLAGLIYFVPINFLISEVTQTAAA